MSSVNLELLALAAHLTQVNCSYDPPAELEVMVDDSEVLRGMTVHCQSGLRVSYHLLLANSAVITMENDKVLSYQITVYI